MRRRGITVTAAALVGVSTSMPWFGVDYGMYWSLQVLILSIPLAAIAVFGVTKLYTSPRFTVLRLAVSLLLGEAGFSLAWAIASGPWSSIPNEVPHAGAHWSLALGSVLLGSSSAAVPWLYHEE